MKLTDTIYKETKYNENYYFKVSIPVHYTVKQEFSLYEDDFGNPYYEKEYNFDPMDEATRQNPIVNEIKEYLKSKNLIIEEEGIE